MKRIFNYFFFTTIMLSLATPSISGSYSDSTNQKKKVTLTEDENAISQFSASFNPLGFVQFGPIINAELGVKDNIAVNLHIRLVTMGVLSYVIRSSGDGLDNLSGIAFGGGILFFPGTKRSKPYIGALLQYEKTEAIYASGYQWEWSETNKTILFVFNGGYRFRFPSGFFINTGAYLGVGNTKWDWDYTYPGYGNYDYEARTGSTVTPFGMLEVAFGMEFK